MDKNFKTSLVSYTDSGKVRKGTRGNIKFPVYIGKCLSCGKEYTNFIKMVHHLVLEHDLKDIYEFGSLPDEVYEKIKSGLTPKQIVDSLKNNGK